MGKTNAKRNSSSTAQRVLTAARETLMESGFAALSTRKVANRAGVPLSQIHYHFGSKDELVLSLLRQQDEALIERQSAMFALDLPLSERWDRSCDYLDADLESGYVRVLQEMTAAGWSSNDVREALQEIYDGWRQAHVGVVESARARGTNFGSFTTPEIAALVAALFLGAESMLLLGRESDSLPIRQALRRVGETIALLEPTETPTEETT